MSVFTAVRRRQRLPSGRVMSVEVILHPGAVVILPIASAGEVLLLRQYRPSVRRWLWELPAGTLERGETPLACAKREIIEETGFAAQSWRKLASFFSAPGFCTEKLVLYAARNLRPATGELDADENLRVVRLTRRRVEALIRSGRIVDAKTLVGLLLWLGGGVPAN